MTEISLELVTILTHCNYGAKDPQDTPSNFLCICYTNFVPYVNQSILVETQQEEKKK